jgi:transposase
MAFLRIDRKASGNYLSIAETYRTEQGKVRSRILFNLGKKEQYSPEQLRRIGTKLYELGGGDLKELLGITTTEIARYNYGYFQVYLNMLKYFGLDNVLKDIGKKHKLKFDLLNATMLMLLERLNDPSSKRSNYFNQSEYLGIEPVDLQHLYRALDKLADYNNLIQKHIYQKGRDLFNQKLDVVFYDVTTLYFDSEVEEPGKLRQLGFGKDGKIGKTQILFCMLIDRYKQPIGYRIFEGTKFEGHTFEDAINDLKNRFQIDKVIVVADRGMLSMNNINIVIDNSYEFIVGERLRNLPKIVQEYLLDLDNYSSQWEYLDSQDKEVVVKYCSVEYLNRTIIGTYSLKRVRKDKFEREKKLKTAEKLLSNPSLINKKASRYFLKKKGENRYLLDDEKIKKDEKYDGFLAISTNNTNLDISEILDQYKQLYRIEHTFRTFKSHLETRPMYHWTDNRIRGHICLCYMAYTLLNRTLLKLENSELKISENQLRKLLDKMQLSLLEHDGKRLYMRSAQQPGEVSIQKKLGVKTIPNIVPVDQINQYI